MVYDLIEAVGLPLTADVAVNLYTAIVTDTGSFRYSNTTPKTFRVAARLVEAGASIPRCVATTVYETRQPGGLRLLGQILQGDRDRRRRRGRLAGDRPRAGRARPTCRRPRSS